MTQIAARAVHLFARRGLRSQVLSTETIALLCCAVGLVLAVGIQVAASSFEQRLTQSVVSGIELRSTVR
jgi:hypothetical protein